MTRIRNLKNLTKKDNKFYFLTLLVMTLILIGGIQSAYAYYYYKNPESLTILSNLIGDFDSGNGDINIIVYKETGVKSDKFEKTYSVPEIGYSLNIDKTSCKSPSGQIITCKKDNPDADCNYTFDSDTKEINLTSNQKVTCEFYFNKDYENDIELYIMMQDGNGTHTREHYDEEPEDVIRTYRNVDNIPAYGFTYSGYYCQNGSTVEIDEETGNIKVLATQRDVCYAYYDGDLQNADIIANVYVQKVVGGNYVKVSSIPNSQKYKIAEEKESYCHTEDGTKTSSVPTYENFYINIPETDQKQVCEVYLDIDNS